MVATGREKGMVVMSYYAEASTDYPCRLHLISPVHCRNHSPQSSLLQKELGVDIYCYFERLQQGQFFKSTEMVRFLQNRVNFKIDTKVLRLHFRYIQDTTSPPKQEGMLLLKRLQELQRKSRSEQCVEEHLVDLSRVDK